jgi:hypothetical protein
MPFAHCEIGFPGLAGNRMNLQHKSKSASVMDTKSLVTLRREVLTLDVRADGAYAKEREASLSKIIIRVCVGTMKARQRFDLKPALCSAGSGLPQLKVLRRGASPCRKILSETQARPAATAKVMVAKSRAGRRS